MVTKSLQSLGWGSFFHDQCLPSAHHSYIPARVISQHNERYRGISELGEFTAKVTGKFRYTAHRLADYPVVGDFVWLEPTGDQARIHTVLHRKNSFSRKMPISGGRKMKNGVIEDGVTEEQVIASNLDALFNMCGVDVNFNIPRLERYLTLARHQKLEAVILINKIDLCKQPDNYVAQVKEIAGGAAVLPISAAHRTGLDPLAAYMAPGKTIVFLGSSGVGKSTLLNTLLEREVQTTRRTSHYSGKGKHTTTHRQLFFHSSGCMIVDTPGMKELQLWADDDDLDSVFADVIDVISQCKFSNCTHRSEPGCALQSAIQSGTLPRERYERYTAQLRELKRLQDKKKNTHGCKARKINTNHKRSGNRMLKLKYLFNNVNLAEMLLKNWEYDSESVDMFQYYRISSNAIYPFRYEGKTRLLRFAPSTEKCKSNIAAELEFISYLRGNGYGALEPVASLGAEEVVEACTPWGTYYASVFKRVPGVQISQTDCNDEIMFCYGKALGKLHQLSSEYVPVTAKRWSCLDVLAWIEELFIDSPQEEAALAEAGLLRNYFASLPVTKHNFGLVHYNFEYDNVFYDQTSHSCHVIDFDDAMYHWYAMDIEQTLASLQDCLSPDSFNTKKQCFLDGYRTEFDISDDMEALLPACRRFAAVYGYARV